MTIIDRRKNGKNKSAGNRQKFLKRYKNRIKRSVDNLSSDKGVTDVLNDRQVTIPEDDLNEPTFNHDLATGERDVILPGNKDRHVGDRIYGPPQEEGQGTGGSEDGDGMDEFTFTLTKDEFLELYFGDMELPNFIKEAMKGSNKYKMKRTGYSKDGIPPRLDLVKTLKQAMSRRIATRQECEHGPCPDCDHTGYKKQRYLDDVDLRYKHFTKQPFPVKQAVMILLMDVSASMGEFEKTLAKKFFLLLYLFLHKCYDQVDIVFISHTHQAKEVTEQEFFYGKESGGTKVSSGLEKANQVIDDKIDLGTTNIYLAQASDGDNWSGDDHVSMSLLEELLGKVQYFAYIQTEEADRLEMKQKHGHKDLMALYKQAAENHKNLQCRHVTDENEVYPVLRSLFEKE